MTTIETSADMEEKIQGVLNGTYYPNRVERDEMKKYMHQKTEELKQRLNEVEKKVEEWGAYIKQYCPDFNK